MTVPSKHPRENLPEAARVVLPVELGPTVTIMSINKNILSLTNATFKFRAPGTSTTSTLAAVAVALAGSSAGTTLELFKQRWIFHTM